MREKHSDEMILHSVFLEFIQILYFEDILGSKKKKWGN